jgi:hypothetical protein
MRTTSLIALLVLSACGGSWSNKDLEFVSTLPSREALASNLPQPKGSPLTGVTTRHDGLNAGDPSQAYARTRKASADFNSLLDFLLGVVEKVRSLPPSARTATTRTWGPYADQSNPGFKVRLTITQVDLTHYQWVIDSLPPTGEAIALVTGGFEATASLLEGKGTITVHVKDFRDRLKVSPELAQLDEIDIGYVTDQDPRLSHLVFTVAPGSVSGLSSIGYTAKEKADGSGAMDFLFDTLDPNVRELEIGSVWLPSGAGVAGMIVKKGTYAGATVIECWDASFLVTYYAESWAGGVKSGKQSDCVQVSGL